VHIHPSLRDFPLSFPLHKKLPHKKKNNKMFFPQNSSTNKQTTFDGLSQAWQRENHHALLVQIQLTQP